MSKLTDSQILNKARKLVAEQAENEGLWFIAETITEAYFQHELRRLHAIIEDNDMDLAIIERRIKE